MRAAPTATPSPIPPTPTPTPTSTRTPTPVPATGHDDVEIVEVPAGEFIMGTSLEDYNEFFWTYVEHDGHRHTAFVDEIPNFAVSLPGFSIDRLEVTNARYRRCIQTGVCPEPSPRSDLPDDYTTNPAYDDHPALVTELAARSYCQWGASGCPRKPSGKRRREGQMEDFTLGEMSAMTTA